MIIPDSTSIERHIKGWLNELPMKATSSAREQAAAPATVRSYVISSYERERPVV
ncbi:hypothetical protein J4Q44_G00382120 [Coregonus suidteri]|uniref:Uncharacterized protein n=1 Tax=Coregonus suidteri TaxID=861788 RepID=A0AAN8KRP9_9TELE